MLTKHSAQDGNVDEHEYETYNSVSFHSLWLPDLAIPLVAQAESVIDIRAGAYGSSRSKALAV